MFTNETTSRRRAPLRHNQQHPAPGSRVDDGCCVTIKSTTANFPINRGSVLRIKPIPPKSVQPHGC
ncbi:hypothetical protein OUZ56_008159 [Daphnia magna]|uniref:Uncharacterized protein n=1 Tax=Daphnia magna TaxID=35525 RepID=A0ABR0ACH4_9CRUS|nr:hypothetical protein OUZ56_008159 [Daphnia magna]